MLGGAVEVHNGIRKKISWDMIPTTMLMHQPLELQPQSVQLDNIDHIGGVDICGYVVGIAVELNKICSKQQ